MYEQGVRRLEAVARAAAFSATRRRPMDVAASLVRQRLVGASRWAGAAPALIAARASASGPVVVHGEAGTGKRFVARLLHDAGPWPSRPFIEVVPDDLTDSALVALVLDDTATLLPLAARAELEQLASRAAGGTIYVSGASTVAHDVLDRVLMLEGSGRPQDYRTATGARVILGVDGALPMVADYPSQRSQAVSALLRIPPLRERPEDIELLAEHFASDLCVRLDKEPRTLAPAVVTALRHHDWPGNVAELRRTIEHMVRRAGPPVLEAVHLPVHLRGQSAWIGSPASDVMLDNGLNLHEEVQRYERSLLTAALDRCAGVQTRAAELLGLKISTLNSKLAAHGIDARAFKVRGRRMR